MLHGTAQSGERRLISRVLVSPAFAWLWAGQAFSSFGEYVTQSTVTVWVATDLQRGSHLLPLWIAAVLAAASVPRLLVAPFAGVLADRWPPRMTMVASDLVRAAAFAVGILVLSLGLDANAKVVVVLALLLVSGVVSQFFTPARAALVQRVVPAERRVAAASIGMFGITGVAVIATMIGPLLYASFGAIVALTVNLATFLVSAAAVLAGRVDAERTHAPASVEPLGYWREFGAGIRLAWQSRAVRTVVLGIAVYGISTGVNSSVLALFALKTAGLSAGRYGVVTAMFPAGSLIAVLFVPRLLRRVRAHTAFVAALVAMGVIYAGYSFARDFAVLVPLMFAAGAVFAVYSTVQGPILQDAVPPGFMGRITALTTPVLAIASLAASAAASGALALVGRSWGTAATREGYAVAILVAAMLMAVGGGVLARARRTPAAS